MQLSQVVNFDSTRDSISNKYYEIIDDIFIFYNEFQSDEIIMKQKYFYDTMQSHRNNHVKITPSESLVNKIWRNFRNYYANTQQNNRMFSTFISELNPLDNSKILEIGCGNGTPGTSYCLLNKNKLDYYIGVDIALNPLRELQNKLREHQTKNFYLFNMNILDNRLIPSQFDLIFGRGILHHFSSPIPIGDRVCSLLKEGGKAVFLEPLNTNFCIKFLRMISKPFRPNLVWEFPYSKADIRSYISLFKSHELHYFDGLSILSLIFAFNNKYFNYFQDKLYIFDRWCSNNSFYKNLFLRAIIVTKK